jgi:hypothetical protein
LPTRPLQTGSDELDPDGLEKGTTMKFAGLLVMPAGFFLSIASLVLFPDSNASARAAFVLCGLAVEALGLVVAARGHIAARGPIDSRRETRS